MASSCFGFALLCHPLDATPVDVVHVDEEEFGRPFIVCVCCVASGALNRREERKKLCVRFTRTQKKNMNARTSHPAGGGPQCGGSVSLSGVPTEGQKPFYVYDVSQSIQSSTFGNIAAAAAAPDDRPTIWMEKQLAAQKIT